MPLTTPDSCNFCHSVGFVELLSVVQPRFFTGFYFLVDISGILLFLLGGGEGGVRGAGWGEVWFLIEIPGKGGSPGEGGPDWEGV